MIAAFPMLVALATMPALAGQSPAVPPPAASAEAMVADAYFEFLLARRLEGEGDADGALAALERAATADPRSAEVRAELAGLYARQNLADEAVAAAEAALALDADNGEAHWVLGTVYAALAQGRQDDAPAATGSPEIAKAIHHLERARVDRQFDLGLHLGLGRLYARTANWSKAIDILGWLVTEEPGVSEAALLLAEAYDKNGQPADAIRVLEQTLGDEPRHFRGIVMLAELRERQRDPAGAAEAYGRAAAMSPRNAELRVRQGSALLASGDAEAARAALAEAVRLAPTDAGSLYLLSDAARRSGELDEAEAVARRLVALEPRGVRGPYALALVFAERREHARVVETLTSVIGPTSQRELSRGLVGPLVTLGFAEQELGRFDAAVGTFERAALAAAEPGVGEIYVAQALVAAGQFARAVEVARRGRDARPDDGRLVRLEARALVGQGEVDAGLALLREQFAEAPRLDIALALVEVASSAERWDEAATAADEAERRFPGEVAVAFQRGALLERQERFADAEVAFREALARDPGHAPTLNYLGYMLVERGERLDEAIALVTKALEVDPFNGAYLDSLGWAHFKKGDLDEALTYLVRAAAILPMNSVVQDHLGDVLAAKRDMAGAIAAWERALAGDGESVDRATIEGKIDEARRGVR